MQSQQCLVSRIQLRLGGCPGGVNGGFPEPLFRRYCRKHNLINMRSPGPDDPLDLSFYVYLKDQNQNNVFVRELGRIEGVQHVNFFFDEEG